MSPIAALAAVLATLVLALGASAARAQDRDAVFVIGHADVPRIDAATVQRLYTGRTVEVAGIPMIAVNALPGSRARDRFMALVMKQDDDGYVAYWTVRKHIGKGAPPRELRSPAEIVEFVTRTPGAVGYLAADEMRPGLHVLLRQ